MVRVDVEYTGGVEESLDGELRALAQGSGGKMLGSNFRLNNPGVRNIRFVFEDSGHASVFEEKVKHSLGDRLDRWRPWSIAIKRVRLRAVKTEFHTIDDLIWMEGDDTLPPPPLPPSAIPDLMGITLTRVEGMSWTKQDDGQLVSLTIHFLPDSGSRVVTRPGAL